MLVPVILRLEDFGVELNKDAVGFVIEFIYRGEVGGRGTTWYLALETLLLFCRWSFRGRRCRTFASPLMLLVRVKVSLKIELVFNAAFNQQECLP